MRTDQLFNRRDLLALGAGALVAARSAHATPSPDEFRRRLTGPILSVPTVYTEDFRIDPDGLRKIVDTGVKAGSHVIALTAGNSQYDRLTFEEIKQLTRTVAQA